MWPYAKAQPFSKLLIFSSMNMKVECIDGLCNEPYQATLNRDLNGFSAPNTHSDCSVGIKCLSSHQRQTLIIGDQHFFHLQVFAWSVTDSTIRSEGPRWAFPTLTKVADQSFLLPPGKSYFLFLCFHHAHFMFLCLCRVLKILREAVTAPYPISPESHNVFNMLMYCIPFHFYKWAAILKWTPLSWNPFTLLLV